MKFIKNSVTVLTTALVLSAGILAHAAVISVNFMNAAGQSITGQYGITNQGTVVPGWVNLNQVNNFSSLPFSDGATSTVDLTGTSTPGFTTGNSGYAGTPLIGGKAVYSGTAAASRPTVTLNNLNTNFPNGYKLIVYFSGFLTCSNAAITRGTTTFYYRPAYNTTEIADSLAAGLVRTTQTSDLGTGNNPLAQYAVFGDSVLLTNNSITITQSWLGGVGGSYLAGFQLVGASSAEAIARIWKGDQSSNWDTVTLNWTNAFFGSTNYAEGDTVIFNDEAVAASPTVNLTAPRSPGSVTVDSTKNYSFTGSGITGATGLVKKGSGSLTLSNPNTYAGNTTISAGTLRVGASGSIPDGAGAGDVSVASGATLDLNGNSEGINGLSGSGTVNNSGGAATLTVGLNNNGGTFAGSIQGVAGFAKQGTNVFTLSGSSSHSGVTTVAQGTLVLNPVSAFSGSSALVVSNGATLRVSVTNGAGLNTSANVSLNGGTALSIDYGNASSTGFVTPIATTGALNLSGVSQIAIAGNSFSVGSYTLITYGSKLGGGSISSTPASLPTGMAATISDTGSSIVLNVTFPSIQSLSYTYGDGGIWATNAAADYWNLGTAAYTEYAGGLGDAVVFGTTYNSFPLSGGTVSLTTDVHPYSISASGSYTLTGPGKITGATGLTMAGASGATFVLDNTNTYTGVTTVSGGTLQINNGSALGSVAGGTVVTSGGSLALSNGITLSAEPLTLSGDGVSGNNGALRSVDTNSPVTVSSPITLAADARIRAQEAELIVASPITDNGSNYMLSLHAGGSSGIVRFNSSSNNVGRLRLYGFNLSNGRIVFGAANVAPQALLIAGGGTHDLGGFDQVFAGITDGTDFATGVITNSSTTPSTLTINYPGTNSTQLQMAILGLVNIVKEGTGVQSFGGGSSVVHAYRGTTTINGGVFGVSSDFSKVTNSFIVNNGGTLRGSGNTIGGPVTVNPGGTFYAGFASNAIGNLTISNSLTLLGNTIIAVNKGVSPSNDVVSVTGALSYGGTLTVHKLGANALVAGDTFTVFPPGGSGSFSSIVAPPGVTLGFANGVITVQSVSAPTLNHTLLGGGVIQFSWTGAFKLQWQTNALSVGLSTNWVDYPDASNPVNVTNSVATPTAFFRLKSL